MSVLIVSPGRDPKAWVSELKNQHPGMKVYVYPEDHDKEEIEYAISWKHPRGLYVNYPNLKVIASMGAGVDHITSDPEIPENIIITRVVDEQLTIDMSAFVLSLIMNHLRNISVHHCSKEWESKKYKRIHETRVGIMGLGELGSGVAANLLKNGFKVSGWARSPKKYKDINSFSEEDPGEFLENLDILVCLLPLTKKTENILCRDLFEKLPKGAFLINVARGEHLVEQDLLDCVNTGQLSGASLDVFRKEPLPEDHPFWEHPRIFITPHIASVTDPKAVVPQLIENYERMQEREDLNNVVTRERGY
jgi:glyoxylate/hydroxypyruvate reductase A